MKEFEPEHKASFDEKGNVVLKRVVKIKKGKSSRVAGGRFELKVRKHLEAEGWIIDKWTNNVDLEVGQVIGAKRKFNPFKKIMTIGTGFPDFIGIKHVGEGKHEIIGVESKMTGLLSKEEKQKCKWLLENNIFSQIFIAKKAEKRGQIEQVDFREKYGKLFKD